MPLYGNIQPFDANTSLNLYRFSDRRIKVKERRPFKLETGEIHLLKSFITLALGNRSVVKALAAKGPPPRQDETPAVWSWREKAGTDPK